MSRKAQESQLKDHTQFMKPLDIILHMDLDFVATEFDKLSREEQQDFLEKMNEAFLNIQHKRDVFLNKLNK